ncbi:uncharacterized protein BX663DRAFT_483439 [Cokeromyces recurvatus]|uniref:uncharacterized protein n=1 Tax=Cokeromyces recurvatus TaxID=90255 RepID=UPI00221F57D1|nr:uncharacterized protein BX663DRAFT_483439 [Cokeromyces recurvatus]KAI7906749.1 hypothetical protein BX663DRAFT_483439 [Cokeromyces recurvatus]
MSYKLKSNNITCLFCFLFLYLLHLKQSASFPPVLIENQHIIDQIFINRLINYSLKVKINLIKINTDTLMSDMSIQEEEEESTEEHSEPAEEDVNTTMVCDEELAEELGLDLEEDEVKEESEMEVVDEVEETLKEINARDLTSSQLVRVQVSPYGLDTNIEKHLERIQKMGLSVEKKERKKRIIIQVTITSC